MTLKKIVQVLKKAVQKNDSISIVINKIRKLDINAQFDTEGKVAGLSGLVITVENEKLFYFENAKNRSSLTSLQQKFNEKHCPPPFYLVGKGSFINAFNNLNNQDDFNNLINSIFTKERMAIIYNQLICDSEILSKHKSTIFESMEAYWMGMDYIHTDSIISVMENALRNLIEKCGETRPKTKFKGYIWNLAKNRISDKLDELKCFYWYPFKCSNPDPDYARKHRGTHEEKNLWAHLDFSMDAINAFNDWFSNVLYKNFDHVNDGFYLNRHNFIHGFSERRAVPVYFPLMLWSLLSLLYIEGVFLQSRDPNPPEPSEEDIKLAEHFLELYKFGHWRRSIAMKYGVSY
jgi:hypothetical protein